MTQKLLPLLAAGVLTLPAFGAVVYDEAIDGPLSNDWTAPTGLTLSAGSNEIFGFNGSPDPRDYVTFEIPVNFVLSSITLLDTAIGNIGFLALQAGGEITLPPVPPPASAAGLLGWWHYQSADIGTDLLAKMSVSVAGSSGFSLPLGPGTYSLWIQDTSLPEPPATAFRYGLDLQLTPVPEPSTAQLVLLSLTGLGLLGKYRRKLR